MEDGLSIEGGEPRSLSWRRRDEVAVVGNADGAKAVAGKEGLDVVEWGGGAGGQTRPSAAGNG